MAEQRLDDADIGATLQQVGGEAVAQCVNGDALAETRRGTRRSAGSMQHDRVDRNRYGGSTYKFCARVEMMSSVAD